MANKVKVPIFQAPQRNVTLEVGATVGAIVGVNLWNADGSLVVLEPPSTPPAGEYPITYWRLIQEIPPNVTALAKTTTTGLYAITSGGTSATREIDVEDGELTVEHGSGVDGNPLLGLADVPDSGIGTLRGITRDAYGRVSGTTDATITGTAGQITVANGDAAAGPPTISLADLPDAGGGAIRKFDRDAKGRVSGTSAATTDDLSEGSANFYFPATRVTSPTNAWMFDDEVYFSQGTWLFYNDINVAGVPFGAGPGGDVSNVVIGNGALVARTTAAGQVAIGRNALADNETQGNNTAIGSSALSKMTSGTANVAFGSHAGGSAVTCAGSVLIGGNAGRASATGVVMSAVAIGNDAMYAGGGTQPVAIGSSSLRNLTSGQGNIGVGFEAGRYQTSGTGNVYFGFNSGNTGTVSNANITGNRNTYIGHNTGPGTPTQLSHATALGAEAVATTSNTVVLGRTTDNTVIGATGDDGSGAKLQATGAIKTTSEYRVGANKVVGARETSWTALAGTAKKGGGATYAAPTISNPPTQAEVQAMADALQDAHQTIKALTDALIAHGLIGA